MWAYWLLLAVILCSVLWDSECSSGALREMPRIPVETQHLLEGVSRSFRRIRDMPCLRFSSPSATSSPDHHQYHQGARRGGRQLILCDNGASPRGIAVSLSRVSDSSLVEEI